jgi:hypothetical protein
LKGYFGSGEEVNTALQSGDPMALGGGVGFIVLDQV